jgi:hypothetical protein
VEIDRLTAVFDADYRRYDNGAFHVKRSQDDLQKSFQQTRDEMGRYTKATEEAGIESEKTASRMEQAGRRVGQALSSVLTGDLTGGAIDSFLNIINRAAKGVPIIGEGLSAALEEAGGAIRSSINTGLEWDAQMRRSEIQFKTFFADYKKEIADLRSFAGRESPFSFSELSQGEIRLKALGYDLKDIRLAFRAAADAGAALGNEHVMFETLMDVLGRVKETGRLTSRELRSLVSLNVPVYDILGEKLHLSPQQVKKLAGQNRIDGETAGRALLEGLVGRYQGAGDELFNSLEVQMQKFEGKRKSLIGQATKPGYDALTSLYQTGNQMMKGDFSSVEDGAREITDFTRQVAQKVGSAALDAWHSVGGFAAMGYGGGIVGAIEKEVIPSATMMVLNAIGAAKLAQLSNSPAKKFEEEGLNAALGYAGGFDKGADVVAAAANRMVTLALGATAAAGRGRLGTQQLSGSLIEQLVREASAVSGLDPAVIRAVIHKESHGRADAISRAGNMGLMQISGDVATKYGATDPLDPRQNVLAGSKYLAELVRQFHGDLQLALAAYNAGPTNVRRAGGVPNFGETKDYIEKIAQYIRGGGGMYAGGDAYKYIEAFVRGRGFEVTAGKEGGHNKGSLHDLGMAVDVRTRDKGAAEVEALISLARSIGLSVKDERERPIGKDGKPQAVWSGPHVHISAPDGWVPMFGKGGDLAGFVDKSIDAGINLGDFRHAGEGSAPMLDLPNMTDESGKVLGVWDAVNQSLQDTGQIVMDVTGNMEPLDAHAQSIQELGVLTLQNWQMMPDAVAATNDRLDEGATKIKVYGGESEKMWKGIGQAFESSMTDSFSRTDETFKSMLSDFILSFAQAVQRMMLAALAANLTKALFGSLDDNSEGGGSGGHGLLGKILGFAIGAVGGAVGGGHGSSGSSSGSNALSGVPILSNFGHRALGGPAFAGQPLVVGDDPLGRPNPEIFIPHTAGEIVPLKNLGSGDSVHVTINQHFHTPTGSVNPRSAYQAGVEAGGALERVMQRRGPK